jgi:hypothetical protein
LHETLAHHASGAKNSYSKFVCHVRYTLVCRCD